MNLFKSTIAFGVVNVQYTILQNEIKQFKKSIKAQENNRK